MSAPVTALPGRPQSAARPGPRGLLEGPVTPTLLRLAAPNVVMTAVIALVSGIDAYFVGKLGAAALAGVSLTFPMMMLMQTMSVGGMGGGIAAAVARAFGAGDHGRANALAVHALAIAVVLGLLFTVLLVAGGGLLYRALGGSGESLAVAVAYSNIAFSGSILLWVFNSLSAVLRGVGSMTLPAALLVGGEAIHVALAPALMFGIGPVPALGVPGAAIATLLLFAVRSVVLIAYLRSGRSRVRLQLGSHGWQRALFWEILRVGIPSSIGTVLTNLNILFVTGFVGLFGALALAGYGMGARLEYLLAPIIFGLGSAVVTMVGANIGAGQKERARRVAWIGAALSAGIAGAIGVVCAVAPHAYMGLFTTDPEAVRVGASYLRAVGPAWLFYGLGLALFFASQGAGRPRAPFVLSVVRFIITAVGGWIAVRVLQLGPDALFDLVAWAFVIYGGVLAVVVKRARW